jgi:NarL family two-component system response regulator LiaR
MGTIRILIVDDHAIVRQGLHAVVRVLPGMEWVGEAHDGRQAIAAVDALRPDIVLMDLVMPEMDGVAAIEAIKRAHPETPIIALTTFAEADLVLGAVQAGAGGYLLKDVEVAELERAIRAVHGGRPYLHPEATRHLLQATAQTAPRTDALTAREREVLAHIAHGQTNRQIAGALQIAEKTVSVHVSNILAKLELESRTQAALYAARAGLVVVGEGMAP